jgi:hypothetical protein
MCDENATYTERATSWLKEQEPTADQIQEAYTKMLTMLAKKPDQVSADTDECLELLVKAYGRAGGSVDDLLSAVEDGKGESGMVQSEGVPLALDCGLLYEVSDAPAVELSQGEKRAVFLHLKEQLQGKTRTA